MRKLKVILSSVILLAALSGCKASTGTCSGPGCSNPAVPQYVYINPGQQAPVPTTPPVQQAVPQQLLPYYQYIYPNGQPYYPNPSGGAPAPNGGMTAPGVPVPDVRTPPVQKNEGSKVWVAIENGVVVIKNLGQYDPETFIPSLAANAFPVGQKFLFGNTFDRTGISWLVKDLNNSGNTPFCIFNGTDCVSNLPQWSGNEFNAYTIINGRDTWLNTRSVKNGNGIGQREYSRFLIN